ncbi:MAG: S41 family peptidase [Candidatus Azobacteroides sp.]|nr:S41 family peptidase [Candidatus Azobacteroides sp.]
MQGFSGNIFNDPAVRKMSIAMAAIEKLYVDTVNNDKLAEDAITSLLEKLDPHSSYMTAEEVKEANEPLQGNFDGIGIQFNMRLTDTLYVIQVITGGPSEKVGLLAGDKIIYVNDTLIAGVKMKDSDVMSKLRGPKGTTVHVKVLREGSPGLLDFKIIRDKIPVYSVSSSYMIDKKNGYIRIDRFAKTTSQEFREALGKLQAQGMENLILDLQDNGGGYLEAAVDLSNEFLKSGSLIVYTEGVNQRREEARSSNSGSFRNGRLVVLVDEASASASEIVSGAIQDWDRGVIVGRRTFGKGLVQRPIPLPDGSMIRLTTARYYTPTGRSIQKPYTKGDLESYQKDLIDRYNHGEMISADSIHFPDSLKYNTLIKNRVVYGGGGIMPDYFIPFDTTATFVVARTTPLFREINNKSILYKYVRTIIEANRKKYQEQYPDFDSFRKNFTVTDNMLNDMLNVYKKEKAEELKEESYQLTEDQQKDLETSRWLFLQWIKMFIAREVYGDNEFYQLMNPLFDSYQKAVEIISDENKYNKLLEQNRR